MDRLSITGQTFNSLTALREVEKAGNGGYYWECICSCGNTTKVVKGNLTHGITKTCGCSKYKYKVTPNSDAIRSVFEGMKNRCSCSVNDRLYSRYAGRGIKVCDEWLNDPNLFIEWAEANGYEKGLQIDRIDNEGNYNPNNCRFVTCKENNRNRRDTLYVLYKGNKIAAIAVAEELGLRTYVVGSWCRRGRIPKKYRHLVSLIDKN